jgi:hypothetical protein
MELSNQALSHLQFQDPMAQKLLSIVSELDASKDRVRRALRGEDPGEPAETSDAADSGQPISGEIMLF